ncbi:MAG: NAD-dependent epimerase/dehydratase family protein, partial [Clostridia bacterium]|nr:NAD-dependent epimerase/dehydratase family protein [Clostridia bacterium]
MASILMFGGSGIISSEIVSLALRRGHDVTIVTRGRRRRFMHPGAHSIEADLREPLDALKEKLAGSYDTVMDFLSYDVDGLRRKMALSAGRCSQYVFISSATAYATKAGRYVEDDPIGGSAWDYANGKAACERFLAEQAAACGFGYTIIRPYVTYGVTRIPLQFAPLEYYTIIHRMRCGKPIPLYERDVRCTLTHSRDFAVAAVGLIQNKNAFSQAYHITGAYETTWTEALMLEAKAFGLEPDIVRVPDAVLRNPDVTRGINAIEVIGDKSRDMLFDNAKIRAAVPEFTGTTTLGEAIGEIAAYFEGSADARRVNYAWDGQADHMLAHSGLLTPAQ